MNKATVWRWLVIGICAGMLIGCGDAPAPENASALKTTDADASSLAYGQIKFVEGYRYGYSLAQQQSKPMLLYFTFENCEYCRQMAADAFMQDQVVNLSDRFVCIVVDLDKEPEICQEFRVKFYPTIQFLSQRGVPLNRLTGKQTGGQVAFEMHAALQAVARRAETPVTTTLR
jgi:protein disulfide-isomerase